ncbi:MAG: thiamine diphosphokinase [Oscillospiraceae bacterium]|nr:thiamine diphosphokinase [Oscillospiraceae bacterium]
MKKCAIFAAAPIGKADYIEIDDETMVICADAGIRHAKALGIKVDLVLGDFDSCDRNETENICTVTFPIRKDDTDLMLAIKYGMQAGCEDFKIYGALGGNRLDHTVAAFSALGYLADNSLNGELVDDKTRVRVLEVGEHIVPNNAGYLSLFPFGCDRVAVELSGTSYDGQVLLAKSFPLGVSNEIISHSAIIKVLQGDDVSRVLMILSKKED